MPLPTGSPQVGRKKHVMHSLSPIAHLREEEVAEKAKEALVMELLREHHVSQGKAAEMLGVNRHELFDLMTRYGVPVIDLTPEELKDELRKPFPISWSHRRRLSPC